MYDEFLLGSAVPIYAHFQCAIISPYIYINYIYIILRGDSRLLSLFTFMHWRRKWQPTPVFLLGETQGQGSLMGCHLWGHTESDTTEATQHQQQQPLKNVQFGGIQYTLQYCAQYCVSSLCKCLTGSSPQKETSIHPTVVIPYSSLPQAPANL